MSKITPQSEAEFLKTMMDRDLGNRWTDDDRIEYLTIVGDHIAKSVGKIIPDGEVYDGPGASPKHDDMIGPGTLGEDRPEFDVNDADVGVYQIKNAFPGATVIDMDNVMESLFEILRPDGQDGMNPVEFIRSGDCLKDAEAHTWLYRNKYACSYDHIHIYDGDMCFVLSEDDSEPCFWVEPDGVREEGLPGDVLKKMFWEYTKRRNVS